MEKVTIVLGHLKTINPQDLEGFIIGVDYGAKVLADHQIQMDLAIGDFDSVTQQAFEFLSPFAHQVIKLDAHKDVSDFEAALAYCQEAQEIIVLGGLGGRFDHQYVNLQHLINDHRLVLIDQHNRIEHLGVGSYLIRKDQYKYHSFFAMNQATISLIGFSYPLDHVLIKASDTYTCSNELEYEKGQVVIHEGSVLYIRSRD